MEKTHSGIERQTFAFDFDNTFLGKKFSGTGESLDDLMADSLKEFSKFKDSDPQKIQNDIKRIQEICKQGMSGEIEFEESLNGRLDILQEHGVDITRGVILKYAETAKRNIDPKTIQLIKDLQEDGHQVVVVSGGFEDWIIPMLDGIIPAKNIRCNKIKYPEKPLSVENVIRQTKEQLIKALKDDGIIKENAKITMIGDGMTDFSVFENEIAQEFIGAFYYEERPEVKKKADEHSQKYFTSLDKFIIHMREKFLAKIESTQRIPAKFLT